MTDDSGLSDDEPDVWKSASKDKKHSLSSKKSDSLKLHIAKRGEHFIIYIDLFNFCMLEFVKKVHASVLYLYTFFIQFCYC